MTALPGDRDQLEFLQHVQRIFDEGEFVATYKFALLIVSKQSPGGDRGARRASARAIRQSRARQKRQELAEEKGVRVNFPAAFVTEFTSRAEN